MDDAKLFTEFNSNKATLIRIDEALRLCMNSRINDKYNLWFKGLAILRAECRVKMDDQQKKDDDAFYRKLEGNVALSSNSSFNETRIDNDLDKYELFLRQIMNDKGMLLKDFRESGL